VTRSRGPCAIGGTLTIKFHFQDNERLKQGGINCTYSVKVQLDILSRSTDRDSSVVLEIGGSIGQWDRAGACGQDVDARVALVHLGDLSLGVVLEVRVASQRDRVTLVSNDRVTDSLGKAVVGAAVDGRGISEGQDGCGQGNEGGDLHG